jgi:NAD(P)-dependent dehydrogenase (short-subunit alcohol dehydrogenase family)
LHSGWEKGEKIKMADLFDLTGKVAVITGGSGMLGAEMAGELARGGVLVAILALHPERARGAAEKIERGGGKAIGLGVDVLDKKSLIAARNEVIERYGRVDILINSAGGNRPEATTADDRSFFELPEEALKWVFDLNLMGTVLTCQVFLEDMVTRQSGSIINISSMAAVLPLTRTIAYSAAKAGVSNFTQWLAVHVNQNYSPNIRVNALAPGFFLTEQNRYLLIDPETATDTERGATIKRNTPMGRYGRPEELLGATIWLASEASSFVNGAVIPVDGGFSAFSGV